MLAPKGDEFATDRQNPGTNTKRSQIAFANTSIGPGLKLSTFDFH